MGLRDKYKSKIENQGFRPLTLSEENLKIIFDKCFAQSQVDGEDTTPSILFSRLFGFAPSDERIIYFDKKKMLENKQAITYLYGQLKNVHSKDRNLKIGDAYLNYTGNEWTSDKSDLLKLLYLGAEQENHFISPIDEKTGSMVLAVSFLKPTLSPKDPNFPAWWEEHKAEWENPAE